MPRPIVPIIFVASLLCLVGFLFLQRGKSPLTLHFLPDVAKSSRHQQPPNNNSTDWSRFAYVQYATNAMYLCNSVMLFETLDRLGSKADRLLMYSSGFDSSSDGTPDGPSYESQLLMKARDQYNVKLQPINVQRKDVKEITWAESYAKLEAFGQRQYDRVLSLDSDASLLQSMDELFLLPPAPVAMPRSYLEDRHWMTSALLLLQPSEFEYQRVKNAIASAGSDEYDMEILNGLYKRSCLVLPHRPYFILTREFTSVEDHSYWLGSKEESWDPETVLKEAKYIHFSDWPTPKPWLIDDIRNYAKKELSCTPGSEEADQTAACREQDLWFGFHDDFSKRRKEVCETNVYSNRSRRSGVDIHKFKPLFE